MGSWKDGGSCPYCGLKYRDFRAPGQPSFSEVYEERRANHDKRIRCGDYSNQPNRRHGILGQMHMFKRESFEEHVRYCAQADEAVRNGEAVPGWAPVEGIASC